MLKHILLLAVLMLGVPRAEAFSLNGPLAPWQIPLISYGLGGDIGGPQNISEEYRRTAPVLYYACDANYIEYFRSNGVYAAEQAAAMFNAVTNVSALSPGLSEFPMEAFRVNYQARALGMIDLKTVAAWAISEQMGLAEPERYTWTLRDRIVGPGGCPLDVAYYIIKRNFDPASSGFDQVQSSSYVNGVLYSYRIFEACSGTPTADVVEFAVDPLIAPYSAVASYRTTDFFVNTESFEPGRFAVSLSRDDVGGLRYMLHTNNINFESTGGDTITFVTNNVVQYLFSSNLTELAQVTLTNNAATLATLLPGLQIGSTTTIFTNVVTTNTVIVFTNFPGDPLGYPARLLTVTVITTNVATHFRHEFLNVVTNTYFTSGPVTVLTTNATTSGCPAGTPYGTVCSNVTMVTYYTNGVFGDYVLLPTNACGVSLILTQAQFSISVTNPTVIATNVNGGGTDGSFFSQTIINTFTQRVFQAKLVECPENAAALRQGINQVRLERREYDSWLGRFYYPVTNEYTSLVVTNNTLQMQRAQRVITVPDFLFTAQDSGVTPIIIERFTINDDFFDPTNALPLLNGPGRMVTPVEFRFNKTGPMYWNHPSFLPGGLDEYSQSNLLVWASFDGSTNAPVLYPHGLGLSELENQVFIHINPAGPALTNGVVGVNYTTVFAGFSVTGGTAPYSWSLLPDAGILPPGLTLGATTGLISGLPTTQGNYTFTIRMTDVMSRFVDRTYSITITP